jgi:hypothetical protein
MMQVQSTISKMIQDICNSELQTSEIQIAATEVLSLKAKDTAASLFDVLNHHPGETVTTNLLSLFHELAIRSPEWVRILEKSVTKRGRCPRPLMATMRKMLADETKQLASGICSIRDLLADLERIIDEPVVQEKVERNRIGGVDVEHRTQWFRSGKVRATVPITTELSDIQRMEMLTSILGSIQPIPNEICFDFSGVEHVYVVGLAALKAWCSKIGVVPEMMNVSNTTERYLEEIGFTGLPCHNSIIDAMEKHYAMAIERITTNSRPETIASGIVQIVDHHMHLSRKNRSGLIVVFAELIENIQRHAGASSESFACAQVYPQRQKLTICIVDAGMGIRDSILSSSNESLI